MIPIFRRGHALEAFLYSLSVVVAHVIIHFVEEVMDRGEVFAVVVLGFDMSKEGLHNCVIKTVVLAWHGLLSMVCNQLGCPRTVLVVKSLVSMDQQSLLWVVDRQGFLQTLSGEFGCG